MDKQNVQRCRTCGCELVNDYEKENGQCINCERDAESGKSVSSASKPVKFKYGKRLTVCEIVSVIASVLSFICAAAFDGSNIMGSASAIVLIIGGFLWLALAVVFGSIREILKIVSRK